jgi:hypothetical protein
MPDRLFGRSIGSSAYVTAGSPLLDQVPKFLELLDVAVVIGRIRLDEKAG